MNDRPQANLDEYNRSLQHTLGSKLFFLPHIPLLEVKQYVDFGCADAALLKLLHAITPEPVKVGIERDPKQRERAFKNFPDLVTFADFEHLDQWMGNWPTRPNCLVMTSVLHEVCSVGLDPWNFEDFWEYLEGFEFDFICIRDFSVPPVNRICKAPKAMVEWALMNEPEMCADMDIHAGTRLYDFMHYLLKRPHKENWERELEENYLFCDSYEFLKTVTMGGRYAIKYRNHTQPKFFREITKRDFGECPEVPTHIELVLERVRKPARLCVAQDTSGVST